MSIQKIASMKAQQKVRLGLGFILILILTSCGASTGGSSGSGGSGGSGTSPTATLVSIAVTPATPTMAVGGTVRLTATGTYSDNSTQTLTTSATWSSSATAVATVATGSGNNPGLVTGVAGGSAMITATMGTVSSSVTVTVQSAVVVTSIAITPASPSVAAGATLQLTATATMSNSTTTDVTHSAAWASSNTSTAIVQTNGQSTPGQVTGEAAGSTTISATYSGVTGTSTVTVTGTAAPLVSIAVTPPTVSLVIGLQQQYTATGTYADNSTQPITRSVNWTTSNTAEATILSQSGPTSGEATAVATGSVAITASLNGITSNGATMIVTNSSQLFSATPITDMALSSPCGTYESFPGGLYENCANTVPADHDADGKAIVKQIQPLDLNGVPSTTGEIILTSIGMSAASDEFSGFVSAVNGDTAVNSATLRVVNGAESNQDACFWFPAYGPPTCDPSAPNNYDRINLNLTTNGFSPDQVQALWLKDANGRLNADSRGCSTVPGGGYCVPLCDETLPGCSNTVETTDALNFEQEMGEMIRAAKERWPNLKLIFITSRIYGGYAPAGAGSPEPFAYECGFAVKWLIQAQIAQQRPGGTIDPVAGDLSYNVNAMSSSTAPWIAWGPYWWANGPNPSQIPAGLVWCDGQSGAPCDGEIDFESDGEHPATVTKQVGLLMNFFMNSPYSISWFPAPGPAVVSPQTK